MREIPLLSSRLLVGRDVLHAVGSAVRAAAPKAVRAVVLTDENCLRYARGVARGLRAEGLATVVESLPPGESRKTLATAAKLYDRLARARTDRLTPLVCVGGGVITDLGGFVAATFMRGIPAFLVPTTLLGQVDAAIGGKTGVNLVHGKNLVGTFTQPGAVFIDPAVLRTLPAREYVAGLGEVVKYGMIRDAELFGFLETEIDAIRRRDPEVLEEIVFRCAKIKAQVVGADERESGERAILNYGHTIGHALEAAGQYRKLHHGEAVSVGMEAEAFIGMEMGLAPIEVLAAQNRLLRLCGLPTRVGRLPRARIAAALKLDKKNESGRPRFVLPEAVGKVRYGVEVSDDLVAAALRTVILGPKS
ncbi:MAG TPA: 3-dehydroquinate synthase [Planctomycetota bacterium]|nr:3-dehydroquinate synthase [Planctomycetota bacterium]